ncbi:MAG: S-layer homology domain-containing protein [Clostridia bacterium]|nr:S-layer homology domain-containing protein [Clostridia bacterium]
MQFKKIGAGLLSLVMLLGECMPAYADIGSYENLYDEQFRAELRGDDEFAAAHPKGQFEFLAGSMNASEDNRSIEIAIVRKGGTKGEVSLDLKAIDVSAKYGEDYVIKAGEGFFKTTLEENPDARPLVDAYSEVSEINETIEKNDDIISVVNTAESGSAVDVDKALEEAFGIEAETEEETEEETETEYVEDSISEKSENKANASGLKNARNASTGTISDRKSWTEKEGTVPNERAVDFANESVSEWADEIPGVTTSVTFADGEYVKTFTAEILDDSLSETDEQVLFFLSNPTGGELGDNYKSYLNIEDNDVNELQKFEMADARIDAARGDKKAVVTIKRTAGIAKFGSVYVTTGEITAKPGIDYKADAREIVFPQGVKERTFEVEIIKETASQDGLQFMVSLDSSSETVNSSKSQTIVTLKNSPSQGTEAGISLLSSEYMDELKQDENGYYKEIEIDTNNETDPYGIMAYDYWGSDVSGYRQIKSSQSGSENTYAINTDLSRVTKISVVWENASNGTYWEVKKCKKVKSSGYYTSGSNWITFDGSNDVKYPNNNGSEIKFSKRTDECTVPVKSRKEKGRIVFHTKPTGSNNYSDLRIHSVKLYYATPSYTINISNGRAAAGKNNTEYNSYVDAKVWTVNKDYTTSAFDSSNNAYYTYDSVVTGGKAGTNILAGTATVSNSKPSIDGSVTFTSKVNSDVDSRLNDSVYLAGLFITGSNGKTGFIEGSKIDFKNAFVDKYIGNRYESKTITVVPVYYPKSAFIHFPQTSDGAVTAHNSDKNNVMKVTRLDNVEIKAVPNAGKYVSGFNVLTTKNNDSKVYSDKDAEGNDISAFRKNKLNSVDKYYVADRTGVTWYESSASTLNIKPGAMVTSITPIYGEPYLKVRVNPRNSSKAQGGVYTIDDNILREAGVDEEGNVTEIRIDPMTMGKTYTFNSVVNEGYITKWQDFTGDVNSDGILDEAEKNENLDIDRSAVVGSVYSYVAKLAPTPVIYYGFYKKTDGDEGVVNGKVQLQKKAVFSEKTYTVPVQNATVAVNDVSAVTDSKGAYQISSADFIDADKAMVNVTFDGNTYSFTQDVNIYKTIKIDEYDTISVTEAEIYKANESGDYSSIGINEVENFDSNIKINIKTKSSSEAVYANKAIFRAYDKTGKLICSDDVTDPEKGGSFSYEFNPAAKGISPGSYMTVQFYDQNGKGYIEHNTGITFARYTGTFTILASFDTPIKPVFDLLGSVDTSLGLGLSGKTDKYFTASTAVENGMEVEYKTLSFGFNKDWSKEGEVGDKDKKADKETNTEKLKDAVKEKAEGNEDATIKTTDSDGNEKEQTVKEAVKDATDTSDNGNKKKTEITKQASLSIAIGLDVIMQKTDDPEHIGEYYLKDILFTVKGAGGFGMEAKIPTPIAINIVIGFEISGEVNGAIIISKGSQADESFFDGNGGIDFGDMTMLKKGDATDPTKAFTFYGSLQLVPSITLKAGVELSCLLNVTVSGTAKFDMNFDTLGDSNGNVKFSAYLGIKVLFFKKEWKLAEKTVSMFALDSEESILEQSVDSMETMDLSYINNRGSWNSGSGRLRMAANNNGVNETTLLAGANPYPKSVIKKLNDGRYMLVFIDDDISKDEYNYATVKYSVYENGRWSQPAAIDNDGTLDDAPDLFVLDNGLVIAAWSSAGEKVTASDNAIEALNKMNIKSAVFDGTSFGEPVDVTYTTAADYCADTQPKFVSGKFMGRNDYVMLYYTKTEYEASSDDGVIGDIVDPYSVTAYMFYDAETNSWINTYSEEDKREIIETGMAVTSSGETVTESNFDVYEKEWYGQSFVKLGTNVLINDTDLYDDYGFWKEMPEITASYEHTDPLVVDSDAVSYNNLSIFAYTVDLDQSQETVYDREIYVQVYDFDTNTFFYPIQITSNSVCDDSVKLGRFDDKTYIAWLSDGNIKALDFSNVYKYCLLEQNVGGNNVYIINKTEGEYIPEYLIADAGEDTEIGEFELVADENQNVYALWTQVGLTYKEGIDPASEEANDPENRFVETQIYMSAFRCESEDDFGTWSAPMKVTEGQGANYSTVTPFVNNGGISALAVKGMSAADKEYGTVEDISSRSLVALSFSDFERIAMSEITVDEIYGNAAANVSVTVSNEGIEDTENLKIEFYSNNELADTVNLDKLYSGGDISISSVVPEGNIEVKLYKDSKLIDTADTDVKAAAELKIDSISSELIDRNIVKLSSIITNNGTADAENVTVKAISDATGNTVGKTVIDNLVMGASEEITLYCEIDDDAFVSITPDDEEYASQESAEFVLLTSEGGNASTSVMRYITKEEKELIDSLSPVINDGADNINVVKGDYGLVYDSVTDEYSSLKVKWISDNPAVADVNSSGLVSGISEGTAALTAMIMPSDRTIHILSDGSYTTDDIYTEITGDGIIIKTIAVNVTNEAVTETIEETTESTTSAQRHSSGGGAGRGKRTEATEATTETAASASENVTEKTTSDYIGDDNKVKSVFDDVKGTWAEKAVMYLADAGIVAGVGNNLFNPEKNVTRAEFVTMLMRMLEGDMNIDAETENTERFDDIDINKYYGAYILKAKALGIAAGYENNEFKPDNNISREEMFAFTERTLLSLGRLENADDYELTYSDKDDITPYAVKSITNLSSGGIVTGSNNLIKPLDFAKRNEAAQMIYNIVVLDE